METGFEHYWYEGRSRVTLPRMIAISIFLHALGLVALYQWNHWSFREDTIKVFHVEFIKDAPVTMDPVVQKPPEPEKKAPPVKAEEKKPEPPKPKVEEKKPEPPKPKVEEKKPEPKPTPKPEPKKKPPELKPIDPVDEPPELAPSEPPKEMISKAKPVAQQSTESVMTVPVELMSWGGLVQRKVEMAWVIPGGVQIATEEVTADVAFTVDRDGNLLDDPVVVKEASDPAVGESGVRAISLAQPFPPFPSGCTLTEQRIIYTFRLVQ